MMGVAPRYLILARNLSVKLEEPPPVFAAIYPVGDILTWVTAGSVPSPLSAGTYAKFEPSVENEKQSLIFARLTKLQVSPDGFAPS